MKFAVGYQQNENDPFVGVVEDYREHVAEIYFPWVGAASGRAALGRRRGAVDWTAQARLEEDLRAFRKMGLKLDLLFNASCYGERAVSRELENEVGSTLDHLGAVAGGVEIVTTTSLAVARTVKKYFPDIEVRASVNMRIGTVEAFSFVGGLFDSFYLQRDRQRDLVHVREVKAWCEENDKGLCLLANSGCLRNCPGQTFHDNLVAHDSGIDERKNIPDWTPHVCWNLYRTRENWPAILQATWIRPEDIHRYDGLADVMKLATRMHEKPRLVLAAYASERYAGNLLDLFEPGFGPAFAPWVLDNGAFPEDWFERTSTCAGACSRCSYCAEVLEKLLVRAE
jgi:collagenase-like PrtC family protease